jgi:hypothetical protein
MLRLSKVPGEEDLSARMLLVRSSSSSWWSTTSASTRWPKARAGVEVAGCSYSSAGARAVRKRSLAHRPGAGENGGRYK